MVSGISFVVLYIPALIMLFLAIGSLFLGNEMVTAGAFWLFLIILVATAVLASVLHGILVALLYHYAKTGEISGRTDQDLVENAFVESREGKMAAFAGGGNI